MTELNIELQVSSANAQNASSALSLITGAQSYVNLESDIMARGYDSVVISDSIPPISNGIGVPQGGATFFYNPTTQNAYIDSSSNQGGQLYIYVNMNQTIVSYSGHRSTVEGGIMHELAHVGLGHLEIPAEERDWGTVILMEDEVVAYTDANFRNDVGLPLREVYPHFGEFDMEQGGNWLIEQCFGPEVPIDMWPLDPEFAPDPNNPFKQYDQESVRAKIWKKPIRLIRVGDYVVSHDKNGNMVPGYVPRTMTNDVKILLDFHGTAVTPGHVYYRPDSKKADKYETLIDVLRDDGMIEHRDGIKLRAATNVPVGDSRDGFVQAIAGKRNSDGTFVQIDKGRIRLGTRFLVGEGKERKSFAVADLIEHGGGVVGDDELIRVGDGEPMPFLWDFGETLPKPEDFVLACSGTTLEDIYKAAEWEGQGPRLSAPMVLDRGPIQPLKGAALSAMPRNEPLDVAHAPTASAKPQRTLNRKQRKAMEAKQRKAAKAHKRMAG